ncbi:MAG TPA: hypothetical protein P5084_05450 [Paludibacter sp.]|nr:hypothetical protein [Paludibacter sp.]
MTVTAQIDISTPTGRRIVKELESHKRVVKLTYNDVMPEGAIPLDDAVEMIWNQLDRKIGYDIRTIQK